MDYRQFAARVKHKYPEYRGWDDLDLTNRVVKHFPKYREALGLPSLPEEKKQKPEKPEGLVPMDLSRAFERDLTKGTAEIRC